MKLNLGCGKQYKKGFINIDAYDNTVADKIMRAHDLQFPSNTVDNIEAFQLLEHLGYFNSLYALAEWFRVLKPSATLIIETPDAEESFRKFLKVDYGNKKEILSWIYGVESPGMSHRLCFPEILLEEIILKTGFINIETNHFEIEKNHPILQLCCKKPRYYQPYQTISSYRKSLIQEELVQIENHILLLEQENLIDFFTLKLKEFIKQKKYKIIDEIVINGSIHSPKMTKTFLNECLSQKIITKNRINHLLEIMHVLISINLPETLITLIKKSPSNPGSQNRTLEITTNMIKQTIKKMIYDPERISFLKKSLLKITNNSKRHKSIFFSSKIIEQEAATYAYQGIKQFTLGNYQQAIRQMKQAIKLDRNHILYYWNLGRLMIATDNTKKAKKFYQDTIDLLETSPCKNKEQLKIQLQNEIEHPKTNTINRPIISVIQ